MPPSTSPALGTSGSVPMTRPADIVDPKTSPSGEGARRDRQCDDLIARSDGLCRKDSKLTHCLDYYPRLRKVREFTDDQRPLEAQKAAEVADLEPHYFSTFFHDKVGVTYTEWRHIHCLARAIRQLLAEDSDIETLASDCGFQNTRALQRTFKAKMGVTPTTFRAAVREQISQKPE